MCLHEEACQCILWTDSRIFVQLCSFSGASSPTEQHTKWLDHLRQGIWDRITQENESIPSFTALQLHWKRCCWVLHMWQQAESNNVVLAPLSSNGWARDKDGSLVICWDTEDSRRKVKELLKGCGCKSGCKSGRCGCIKGGDPQQRWLHYKSHKPPKMLLVLPQIP